MLVRISTIKCTIAFYINWQVFEGVETVDLECSSSGNPYPKYSWYRGLTHSDSVQVTSETSNRYTLTGGKFTIEGPDSNTDLSSYHCKSENKIGVILSNQAKILFGCKLLCKLYYISVVSFSKES